MQHSNKPTVWLIRCDHLGDLIITLPIVAQITKYFEAKIVVEKYLYDIAKHLIKKNEIILSNDFLKITKFSKNDILIPFSMSNAVRQHTKKHFKGVRLGYALRTKDWFFANKLSFVYRNKALVHESELLRRFAASVIDGLMPFSQVDYQTNWLKEFGFELPYASKDTLKKKIVFHPGSNQSGREWPAIRWAELIDKTHALGHTVYVTGRSLEAQRFLPQLHSVADKFINCIDQDIDMIALTERILAADVVVSSGTGPAHLAASFGIAVITLFPPIKRAGQARWLPIGSNVCGLTSSEYGVNSFCTKARNCKSSDCVCMSDISADMVFDELRRVLA